MALHLGSLEVVQPIMVSELVISGGDPLALVLHPAARARSPRRRRDRDSDSASFWSWRRPRPVQRVPSDGRWLGAGVATAIVVAVCWSCSARAGPPGGGLWYSARPRRRGSRCSRR
jgi:hypothetical protein